MTLQNCSQDVHQLYRHTSFHNLEISSMSGPEVAHQQAGQGHGGGFFDNGNAQHAAILRLPKMHELPPLNTQLIPASLAAAFGIKLTDSDDAEDDTGLQQGQAQQQQVQPSSKYVQQQQAAAQYTQQQPQQQQPLQAMQAQAPYAGPSMGLEPQERQGLGQQQFMPFATGAQDFHPMMMGMGGAGGMQAGAANAVFNSFGPGSMYGYDPREAMAAGYNLARYQQQGMVCVSSLSGCMCCAFLGAADSPVPSPSQVILDSSRKHRRSSPSRSSSRRSNRRCSLRPNSSRCSSSSSSSSSTKAGRRSRAVRATPGRRLP